MHGTVIFVFNTGHVHQELPIFEFRRGCLFQLFEHQQEGVVSTDVVFWVPNLSALCVATGFNLTIDDNMFTTYNHTYVLWKLLRNVRELIDWPIEIKIPKRVYQLEICRWMFVASYGLIGTVCVSLHMCCTL